MKNRMAGSGNLLFKSGTQKQYLSDPKDLNDVSYLKGASSLLSNSRPVTEDDIPVLITRFQGVLCLHHWRIRYKIITDDKLGKSLMMIKPNRDRQIATIYIRQSLLGRPTRDFGPLLLHEMLHLVLEPVVEEHSFQLEYEVDQQRAAEYRTRFVRVLEKTVEVLADNISKLVVLKDEEALGNIQEGLVEVQSEMSELRGLVYGVGEDNDDDDLDLE